MYTKNKQGVIVLKNDERETLRAIIRKGTHNAHVIMRARILLESHKGGSKNGIAAQLGINRSTVQRVRDRFAEGGCDHALYDLPRSGQPPKLDDKAEAHLVAIACSDAPEGRDHWTLELLQKRMIKDGKVKRISTVALWKRLTERGIKPWREKNVVYSRDHP